MKIVNTTRKTVVTQNAKDCTTLLSQGIGLMFRTKITPLLFALPTPCRITIHGFFMLKTIDVMYLDENKQVIDFTTLKPWTWHTSKEKAKYVLEVQKWVIQKTGTRRGDSVYF